MQTKRNGPATNGAAPQNITCAPESTATFTDFDFDVHIVSQVDKSLWEAVFDGHFRLAVKCDVCGRWLTSGKSKRAHRGPRCAAKAANHG